MAKKYKLTGCAKFFIFFIIAAPIAYIGASYYNGQDPIGEVREFVEKYVGDRGGKDANVNSSKSGNTNGTVYTELELKELKIKNLQGDLKECEEENKKQSELIKQQKKEIERLNNLEGQ